MSLTTQTSPLALAAANRKHKRKTTDRSVTPRVKQGVLNLIYEGCNLHQAAEKAGLSYRSFHDALRKPAVIAFYKQEMDVFRRGATAGNIRAVLEIRDDPTLRETAAGQKVRIEAAKYLDGNDERRGTTVNVGIAVTPGYVIDLRPGDELERGRQLAHLIDIDPKSLSHQASVPQEAAERDEEG